jgi:hypothetical protein
LKETFEKMENVEIFMTNWMCKEFEIKFKF